MQIMLLLVLFLVVRAFQEDCGMLPIAAKLWKLATTFQREALPRVRHILPYLVLHCSAYKAETLFLTGTGVPEGLLVAVLES